MFGTADRCQAADSTNGPTFTVTNASDKTLTACYVQTSVGSARQTGIEWDALLQSAPPLGKGASVSLPLPHKVGGPLPDRAEILAGIWADGETFGNAEMLNRLTNTRAMRESEFDSALALLQRGLGEKWSRPQYLKSLEGQPNSAPVSEIRRNLQFDTFDAPDRLNRTIRKMLDAFTQRRDELRNATTHVLAPAS